MARRAQLEAEVRDEYLAAAAEQVQRMSTIIRQLMDFTRRREPKVATVDLRGIVESIARLVTPMAKNDATQLEQVVSNLVVNAVQASAAGSEVELSCGVEPQHGTRRAFVRVEDHGHGMDEATSARVFEPFFTTKAVGDGTGLGLSVAHGIVTEHGGSIVVHSQQGRGSVFSVLLPLAAA
jgi:signal transduction histidine kinase